MIEIRHFLHLRRSRHQLWPWCVLFVKDMMFKQEGLKRMCNSLSMKLKARRSRASTWKRAKLGTSRFSFFFMKTRAWVSAKSATLATLGLLMSLHWDFFAAPTQNYCFPKWVPARLSWADMFGNVIFHSILAQKPALSLVDAWVWVLFVLFEISCIKTQGCILCIMHVKAADPKPKKCCSSFSIPVLQSMRRLGISTYSLQPCPSDPTQQLFSIPKPMQIYWAYCNILLLNFQLHEPSGYFACVVLTHVFSGTAGDHWRCHGGDPGWRGLQTKILSEGLLRFRGWFNVYTGYIYIYV